MIDLDHQAMEQLRANLQERIDREDRRHRFGTASREIMRMTMGANSGLTGELLAEARARSITALLRLENSVANFESKAADFDAITQSQLASARRRTAAFERWLEALS